MPFEGIGDPVGAVQVNERIGPELTPPLAVGFEQSGEAPPSAPPPDPGKITRRYPEDTLPGPAAWLDGDYKLHRPTGALHNLAKDPVEKVNLAATEPGRVVRMQSQLEAWQKSVVRSLNGEDY